MRLYAKNLKIADNVAGLAAATAKTLTGEGAEIIIEDTVLEEMHSDSPVAAERYSVGAKITIKAVVTGHTIADLSMQLNSASSSSISIASSRIYQIPKKAVSFEVALSDGSTTETYQASSMQYTGNVSAPFKGGNNMFFLPIELSSTASCTLAVTQA